MSGVTAVLASYGNSEWPPIPPFSQFTMTNVDILFFETTINPTVYATVCDGTVDGNVNVTHTPPASPPFSAPPTAYVQFDAGAGGMVPPIGPDPDYTGVFPAPNYTLYNNVNWGSSYVIWYGNGPGLDKGMVGINFNVAKLGWTTQTKFTGRIYLYPYDWDYGAAATTIQITPYTSGTIQRSGVGSEVLVVVGGTAGSPYTYSNYNYIFDVGPNQYLYKTYVDYEYTIASKVLTGTVGYELIPN